VTGAWLFRSPSGDPKPARDSERIHRLKPLTPLIDPSPAMEPLPVCFSASDPGR
jgi:hypothetical protein